MSIKRITYDAKIESHLLSFPGQKEGLNNRIVPPFLDTTIPPVSFSRSTASFFILVEGFPEQ
jgi:hypothetical protein